MIDPDELAELLYDRDEDMLREGIAVGDLDDRGRIIDDGDDEPLYPCGMCGHQRALPGLTACGRCA